MGVSGSDCRLIPWKGLMRRHPTSPHPMRVASRLNPSLARPRALTCGPEVKNALPTGQTLTTWWLVSQNQYTKKQLQPQIQILRSQKRRETVCPSLSCPTAIHVSGDAVPPPLCPTLPFTGEHYPRQGNPHTPVTCGFPGALEALQGWWVLGLGGVLSF